MESDGHGPGHMLCSPNGKWGRSHEDNRLRRVFPENPDTSGGAPYGKGIARVLPLSLAVNDGSRALLVAAPDLP